MSILNAMFIKNSWLWFHILGGGIIAKACLMFGAVPQVAFIITLGVAIVWEILEYNIINAKQVYGSQKRFFGDALGDIFGACAMALVVVI